jgi:hypothetical protein
MYSISPKKLLQDQHDTKMIIYVNIKTTNMSYKIIQSKKIVFSPDDDRHILIVKENNEIIGLNYCQGDDLEYFSEYFDEIDHDLTEFYNSVQYYLSGESELDKINQAIWAHFDYKNRKHERKYGFMRS